jgi:diadenosine tetraphosphatase ApaH/serine/threonine PP2A family protein phosphatase
LIGLLYDVHGNLPALEAVLEDSPADRYLLGGDYALFGGWPAQTVARLRELEAVAWIRGNGERWTADPSDAPEPVHEPITACRQALGPSVVAELAGLPEQARVGEALACHGSPLSDVRSFFPEPAPDELELLAGVEASLLIFGHTHLPFARQSTNGIELVNPGSVGMPFDGDPRAAYALLHDDGRVEHRRVAYDHLASAAAVRERFEGDWTATVAARIERASF